MPIEKKIFIDPNGGARKGGMDKDTDDRYLQNGYYRNGRNIDFMANGSKFSVTNMKGNTEVSFTLGSGDNLCIGSHEDKPSNTIFFFIWNGSGNHRIFSYNYSLIEDTVTTLASGEGLGFEFDKLITGIDLVLDRYLVWAQDDKEIGCVDLDNAPYTITTSADRWRVELYKVPDPTPLEPKFMTVPSRTTNNLRGKLYKFRSRYVIDGNFRTHPSVISKMPKPEWGQQVEDDGEPYDNQIYIPVALPERDDVEKVELFVQMGSDDNSMGDWYKFAEVTYDEINSNYGDTVTIAFTGSEALEVVDQTEMSMPFSFIPPSCKEIVFLPTNVLGFFNISEGFDAEVEVKAQAYPVYNSRVTSTSSPTITAVYSATTTSDSNDFYNPNFNILLNTGLFRKTITIGGTIKDGDLIRIELTVSHTGSVPVSFSNITIDFLYPVKGTDTTTTVANKLAAYINSVDTRYLGFGGIIAYNSANVVRLVYGVNQNNSPYTPSSNIASCVITTSHLSSFTLRETKNNFKRWADHPFAIQYNKNGRRSSAIPLTSFYSLGYDRTSNDSWVDAKVVIEHTPPDGADSYDILYAKNTTIEDFLQLWVNILPVLTITYDAGTGTRPEVGQTVSASSGGSGVVLAITEGNSIEGSIEVGIGSGTFTGTITFDTSTWSATITDTIDNNIVAVDVFDRIDYDINNYGTLAQDYAFVDGDQIRLIAINNSGFTYFTDAISTPITKANDHYAFFKYDVSTLSVPITASATILCEMWRPKYVNSARKYYEIGHHYEISGGYHMGSSQDQTASVGAIISITDAGDSYERYTPSAAEASPLTYFHMIIEGKDFSPMYASKVTSVGRVNVETDSGDDKIDRESSIAYSQPIIPQSTTNGLSVVLGSSIVTYNAKFGGIQKAKIRNDRELIVYFEDKVGSIGLLSELQKGNNGVVVYSTSTLLNGINYYAYDGGIGVNPESFANYGNTQYFAAVKNNAICRLDLSGITEISDYGMSDWFNTNLDIKSNFIENIRVLGAFDERRKLYIISIQSLVTDDTISGGSGGEVTFTATNISLSGVTLSNTSRVLLYNGVDTQIPTLIDVYPTSPSEVVIEYTEPPTASLVTSGTIMINVGTLMFNEDANAWVSFLDFIPDNIVACGVDYASFNEGSLWIHNTNSNRGRFYGVDNAAEITLLFNQDPHTMKLIQTIEQETNSVWVSDTDGDVSTGGGQTSLLEGSFYSEYQPREWAAAFRQDSSTPNIINPLLDGYDLRDRTFEIRLVNSDKTEVKLESVSVLYRQSDSSM